MKLFLLLALMTASVSQVFAGWHCCQTIYDAKKAHKKDKSKKVCAGPIVDDNSKCNCTGVAACQLV